MDQTNASILLNCSVLEDRIVLPGATTESCRDIIDEFRHDLLSCNIPHWKVVGVAIETGLSSQIDSYIAKIRGVSKSYAELLIGLNNLVFAEGGGCLAGIAFEDDCKFLFPVSLMISDGSVITSSNNSLYYEGRGIGNAPDSLVEDKEIIRFDSPDSNIRLLLTKGIGYMNFRDSSKLLFDYYQAAKEQCGDLQSVTKYVPLQQVFDLNYFISIHTYEQGDTEVHLRYKDKINSCVLQQIIHNYAESKVSGGKSYGEDKTN